MSCDPEAHCLRSQWKNLVESMGRHPADFQSEASEKQRTVREDRAGHALGLSGVGTVAGNSDLSEQILGGQCSQAHIGPIAHYTIVRDFRFEYLVLYE